MHAIAPNSPRSDLAEWIQTVLLGANLTWTTLCLGGYRPETMLVTGVLTAVTLAFNLAALGLRRSPPGLVDRTGAWFLPFLAYAALNVMAVTPVPWLGWLDWILWANLLATFWIVRTGIRSPLSRLVLFALVVALGVGAVGLAAYQRFVRPEWLMLGRQQAEQFIGRSSGPFGIPNSLGAFLILLLPALSALALRRAATATARVGWGWMSAVLGFGVLLSLSRGAWLALAAAVAVWPFIVPGWRWRRRVGLALLVLVALAGTGSVVFQTSAPARERLTRLVHDAGELSRPILWRGAWALVREQPLVGTGAGSFNVAFERHRPAGFVDEPQWAHNDYLNTLSDYGLIGFSLLLAPAGWLVWCGRSAPPGAPRGGRQAVIESPAVRRALGIGLLAFALHLVIEFHLKLPALGMTFAVMAALSLGRGGERRRPERTNPSNEGRRWAWVAGALFVLVMMVPLTRFMRAETLRYAARESVDREIRRPAGDRPVLLAHAERELRRAVELWAQHAGAWSDLARVVEFQAYLMPERRGDLAPAAEDAARRALALSADVSEFWIRLGVALDLRGQSAAAAAAYERSLALAPRSSAGWYYYAFHLSQDTERREAALRAIATCLSLDPGNAAAEALRATLVPRP